MGPVDMHTISIEPQHATGNQEDPYPYHM